MCVDLKKKNPQQLLLFRLEKPRMWKMFCRKKAEIPTWVIHAWKLSLPVFKNKTFTTIILSVTLECYLRGIVMTLQHIIGCKTVTYVRAASNHEMTRISNTTVFGIVNQFQSNWIEFQAFLILQKKYFPFNRFDHNGFKCAWVYLERRWSTYTIQKKYLNKNFRIRFPLTFEDEKECKRNEKKKSSQDLNVKKLNLHFKARV